MSWAHRFVFKKILISSLYRFGHLQDVTQLLRNGVTMAQVKDYVTGILFIPCFIVAVFLLWILMSFIFACCCCGRAGYLSGKRFVRNYEEPKKCCSNARNSRITFLLSSALVVAFAAIFSLEGIVNVESSLNTFNESLKVSSSSSTYTMIMPSYPTSLCSKINNFLFYRYRISTVLQTAVVSLPIK